MSFRLLPKIGDLERRNSSNLYIISPYSVAFGADYVKLLKIYWYFLWQKCRPNNLVNSRSLKT